MYQEELEKMGRLAVAAAAELAALPSAAKRNCLLAMATAVEENAEIITRANTVDVASAITKNLSPAMVDRLTLTPERIKGMADGLRTVASQDDPVGKVISKTTRPNGLEITKVSVPFGVIGIIYESRPNVTVDAAGICIMAGNAVILRGGSEAFNSNQVLAGILNKAAIASGLPDGVVSMLPWTDHEAVTAMLKMDKYIDLVIPRGGERLIRTVTAQATMPVLKHYKGVCHLYVDEDANLSQAIDIIINAKCQRPGVCNALETLLISKKILPTFAPMLVKALQENKVICHGDSLYCSYDENAIAATEDDYYAEYLALELAIKTVEDVKEAVAHINNYGSKHSDGIISNIASNIAYFQQRVDSSCVYANASTRFTDGGQFGMGAEIGISTDKLHARGPMGADELTSYKYLICGTGQIRN
jgi:glutamate-5-semialdehyde dehydrogenase